MKHRPPGSRPDGLSGRTHLLRRPSPAALVFAALVVASIGAFFVTTRLKRTTPVIEHLRSNRFFSPNGDHRLDLALFGFRLRRTDEATISIVTRDGTRVRTIAENLQLRRKHPYRFRWDGRTDGGRIAHDGEYHVRVSLRHQGRVATSPRKIILDTTPPRTVVRSVTPEVITPTAPRRRARLATIRFSGPKLDPTLMVYRTDSASPRLVARRAFPSRTRFLRWDGRVGLGAARRPAPSGSYLIAVRVRDRAGNLGPLKLPPTRQTVTGHPGVVVRYVAAQVPAEPVRAGDTATFKVFAGGRRYRWRARSLAGGRSLARGASRAGTLRVPVPRRASGLAFLELRVGAHRYRAPFAIRGRVRRRVLVVLPTVTWQAANPVEASGDGFPDLLPPDRKVDRARPYAGQGDPPGFGATVRMLSFLGRARLRYELTTDIALVRLGAPSLRRYRGILFAGPERFVPAPLADLMREYVIEAGRLGLVGTDQFSRKVALGPTEIVDAGRALPLGERVRRERGPRALVVLGDRIDFFRGVSGAFGPFPMVEASLRLPPGARLAASAGAAPGRPSIVVYRLGRGYLARVGIDGFARALETSAAADRIMRRLWTLLSR